MPADATDYRQRREAVQQAVAAGEADEVLRRARALLELGRSTDLTFCATVFEKMSAALIEHGHRALKTFVVRSVTVEPILPALKVEAFLNGYVLDVQVGGYGSYLDELLNPESALGRSQAELVLVLLDLEEIAGQLPELSARGVAEEIEAELALSANRMAQMLHGYRSTHSGRLVLQGCVLPEASSLGPVGDANTEQSLVNAVRALNRKLAAVCRALPDCLFFDVDQIAAQFGRERWRDRRMFLATRLPLAQAAFQPLAHGLMRTASALFRAPRKVLCTDLDNTLWGGILGEDGPGGIATGSAYPGNCYLAYQRYLRELAMRGVLLAVVSKNNARDVEEAFRLRAADLAVGLDDFVARKIGWYEKADALRELAVELSLGLESFVFIDDNPVECEAIRRQLPQVAVIEAPAEEPWRLVRLLAEQWFFDAASVTADDRHRSQEYKAQAERASLSSQATSHDEFLQSLGMVCTFVNAAKAPLERAVQLLAKTNQFNLTTRRYGAAEVLRFAEDPRGQALAVRVRDRFGDAGVVGLALARQQEDGCVIDSLLLSCRVIGRGIETAMLAEVAAQALAQGCRWLIGEFVETAKNAPCRAFFADHGFVKDVARSTDISTVYRLDLVEQSVTSPPWLTLEEQETYEHADSTAVSS